MLTLLCICSLFRAELCSSHSAAGNSTPSIETSLTPAASSCTETWHLFLVLKIACLLSTAKLRGDLILKENSSDHFSLRHSYNFVPKLLSVEG